MYKAGIEPHRIFAHLKNRGWPGENMIVAFHAGIPYIQEV